MALEQIWPAGPIVAEGVDSPEVVAEGWFRLRGAALPWVMPSGGRALRFRFRTDLSHVDSEAVVDTVDGSPVRPGELFLDARLTFSFADARTVVVAGALFHVRFGDREVGQGAVTRVLRSAG